MTTIKSGDVVLLDFVHGEVRVLTEAEHLQMVVEYMARCTFKNGVCYVDCKPPEDEQGAAA